MNLKYKQREQTHYIYIHQFDTLGSTIGDFDRRMMKSGEFDCGFHFFIREDGTVETGRGVNEVPGWFFESAKHSIYIAVQTKDSNLNDSQKVSLDDLLSSIQADYGDLKVIMRKGNVYERDS